MDWYSPKKTFVKRAAAYYRHSAQERQENSVEIQQDQVRKFAVDNDIQIIEEYIDRGKTGLITEGREAFKRMLRDVETGKHHFDYVLVLDVSRWGRYQKRDIAAYYSALCDMHGAKVIYATIGFAPDNDLIHGLRIDIERYQAANYSRELSSKVFKGCAKIASQGFRAGGMPPYAFHRLLLDEQRNPVQVLEPGQRKSIQNQRVTLIPGQPEQIAVVKRIFRAFVQHKKNPKQIAGMLNGDGIPSPGDTNWTITAVLNILSNELYVGTMVYNKTTQRLKSPSRANPPGEWVRAEEAFPAIIERKVFETAQGIILKTEEDRSLRYSEKEMLRRLLALYERYGTLRGSLIAHEEGMVSSATYAHRFGTVTAAYQRLFAEIIATRRSEVVETIKTAIPDLADFGEFIVLRDYVSIRIQPVVPFPHGYDEAWSFTADARPEIDITLVVPLSNGGTFAVLGYLFLPRLMAGGRQVRLLSTVPDNLAVHAYTISEALQTLIGWETPHERDHCTHE
jgi:DNA invertase Pin-like site-specific DNA recombinase